MKISENKSKFKSGLLNRESSIKFGEVLSPGIIVKNSIDIFIPDDFWKKESLWADLECGHGSLLESIRQKFLKAGHSNEKIISELIFGADIQEESVLITIKNFYGQDCIIKETQIPDDWLSEGLYKMFSVNGKNIYNFVQADSLLWKASWGKKIKEKFNNDLFWIEH